MDTSNWRFRVLLEPRGFIRIIEFVLAIVAFATTGGYSGQLEFSINCGNDTTPNLTYYHPDITYPFRLGSRLIPIQFCNGTSANVVMNGDFSPSAQWFVFVGVTAFLYSLASIVFYVVFDASVRANHERLVTIGDLALTVLYTFFWLTAASAWAWGLGEVKYWSSHDQFFKYNPLPDICKEGGIARCTNYTGANFGPLNASVAFAFLNFFLWFCNVWFVYKESPYHQEPNKNENAPGFGEQSPPSGM